MKWLLATFLTILTACNPLYVIQVSINEADILLKRQNISEVINNHETSSEVRSKLRLALFARDYAESIGLKPKDSFTTYTDIGKDNLGWLLTAARPDEFEMHTWWFPVVGSLPYKGFLSKEEAQEAASELKAEGYETYMRPIEAYSTLGWFNDPLLSTTLKQNKVRIAKTVIHESVHNTIWIKGDVSLNENLAVFIANEASIDFFNTFLPEKNSPFFSSPEIIHLKQNAEIFRKVSYKLAESIARLHQELSEIYSQEITFDEKMEKRIAVFESTTAELRRTFPGLKILKKVNNAEIMQLHLYLGELLTLKNEYENRKTDLPSYIIHKGRVEK